MLERLASPLASPNPVGPERTLRRFSPDLDVPLAAEPDVPLRTTGVSAIDGGWRFTSNTPRVFTLFRFDARELRRGMLIYRAETRSRDAATSAYLEMWCQVPDSGGYFVKGTHDEIKGYRRWRKTELPFSLPADGFAREVTLNLTFEKPGAVELRNVELVWRAVPGLLEPRYAPRRTIHFAWRLARFTGLTAINSVLVLGQLALAVVLGGSDRLVTWWPKKKAPKVGKLSG